MNQSLVCKEERPGARGRLLDAEVTLLGDRSTASRKNRELLVLEAKSSARLSNRVHPPRGDTPGFGGHQMKAAS